MTNTLSEQSLADLLLRVEGASGADREIDWRLAELTDHASFSVSSTRWPPFGVGSKADKAIPTYSASLDATLALVERCLPGWGWMVVSDDAASVFKRTEKGTLGLIASVATDGRTPALALLASMLAALIQYPLAAQSTPQPPVRQVEQ